MQAQARYVQQDDRPAGDQVFRFSGVSWEDYERLLAMRGDVERWIGTRWRRPAGIQPHMLPQK